MAQSEATVTVVNPTPPTNMSFNNYGSPPTPDAMPFVDDGTAGAITAIAAPLSGAVAEASGSVVIDTDPGQTAISVMGNWTAQPSVDHLSAKAPATPPAITNLNPNNIASGAAPVTLVVTGTGFKQNSVVAINGVVQSTIYVSGTSLKVLYAPKKATNGTVPVTVVTAGTASAPSTWTFT